MNFVPYTPASVGPGMVNTPQASVFDVIGAEWRLGNESSMQRGAEHLRDDMSLDADAAAAGETKLTPAELQARPDLKVQGMTYDAPMYLRTAQAQAARQQRLLRDLWKTSQVPMYGPLPHPFSGTSILGFSANMAGSMLHPLDLTTLFIPIAGEEAKGAALLEAGVKRASLRYLMARGIVDSSLIPFAEQFPKLAPRVVNNMAQQALIEIPRVISESRYRQDVDFGRLAEDMAVGAAGAEALHFAVHSGLQVFKAISPRTYDAMFKKGINDFVTGKETDVSDHLAQDPAVVKGEALDQIVEEQRLEDRRTGKYREWAEKKYTQLKDKLEKTRAKLEEHYINMGWDEDRARAEAESVIKDQMGDLKSEAQTRTNAEGAIATVDDRTLHRVATDYVEHLAPEEKTPRTEEIKKLLEENPSGKFKNPADAIRLANVLGLHYDNTPWKPVKDMITSVVDRDPKNGAVLRTLFDEPAVAKAVTDVANRQQRIMDTRIREYVNRKKQAYMEAVWKAPFYENAVQRTQEKLSRLDQTRRLFGWDKPDPRFDTPEKVKAKIPDPSAPDTTWVDKDTQATIQRMKNLGRELTAEEKRVIEGLGEGEEPTQGEVIDESSKKILDQATACLLNG